MIKTSKTTLYCETELQLKFQAEVKSVGNVFKCTHLNV